MVWCLVENSTSKNVEVVTYKPPDFLQVWPENTYTLRAEETRLVTASAHLHEHLYIKLNHQTPAFKVKLGSQLRISCTSGGLLQGLHLEDIDMTNLRVPLLSRRGPSEGNVTQPLQPGDQICTEAQTLPGVMHHGIVYTCNKASITVGHFYDRGVWEAALFGSKGFTTGQVYLVDDWANKDGAAPTVSRDTTVCRVRKELANNDTARSMYNISLFNCEHWATMMRLADQSRRFSRQVHDFKEHESIWDRLGVLRFAVGVTGGAKSVRG